MYVVCVLETSGQSHPGCQIYCRIITMLFPYPFIISRIFMTGLILVNKKFLFFLFFLGHSSERFIPVSDTLKELTFGIFEFTFWFCFQFHFFSDFSLY